MVRRYRKTGIEISPKDDPTAYFREYYRRIRGPELKKKRESERP